MNTAADRAPIAEIAELNRRWMDAYAARDLAFLEEHLAEGDVGTFPDGAVAGKREEIAALKAGRVEIKSMKPASMDVQLYGDAAIITGQSRIEATLGGRAMADDFRFTDVWVKIDGRWRAAASQVTRIEPMDREG